MTERSCFSASGNLGRAIFDSCLGNQALEVDSPEEFFISGGVHLPFTPADEVIKRHLEVANIYPKGWTCNKFPRHISPTTVSHTTFHRQNYLSLFGVITTNKSGQPAITGLFNTQNCLLTALKLHLTLLDKNRVKSKAQE